MNDTTVEVTVSDRLNRTFTYSAQSGTLILDFLKKEGYPSSSVIVYENGEVVSEFVTHFQEWRTYHIEMVRAYHLPDIMDRTLPTDATPEGVVYAKNVLELTPDGGGTNKVAFLDEGGLVRDCEETFVASLRHHGDILSTGDKVVVAFSGGRDSLSLMLLLHRLRDKLPRIDITAVTINDCIDALDLRYTVDLCKELHVNHIVRDKEDIEARFHLNTDFDTALMSIYSHCGRQHTLYTLHFVMRRMVEQVAAETGATKIALGLHLEDIAASILRSMTTGYLVGFPWKRTFGGFTYVYPLWAFPKKELTLYLKFTAHEYSKQGSAATFDRGTVDRDIYYALADHSNDVWPGFALHLFEGYSRILSTIKEDTIAFAECENCGGSFALNTSKGGASVRGAYCAVCEDLMRSGVLVTR